MYRIQPFTGRRFPGGRSLPGGPPAALVVPLRPVTTTIMTRLAGAGAKSLRVRTQKRKVSGRQEKVRTNTAA